MAIGSNDARAVVVDSVSKTFSMPHERKHTLKERVLHPFRREGVETFQALTDVSFSVEPGEFFGIVGRNGSGKSTLLKCLAGIYRADQGQIFVNGRMSTFIELGVGFNPDLAAYDNVLLNAVMLGVPARTARASFDEIIEFAELEEFVDLKIKNYSSGMLVRLAFATAIQAHADILLIDEVLAVGDAAFQQKCFDVFNDLREQGRTILFVTHDMGSVTRFCHRALLLDRGKVVTIDKPEKAAQQYLELNFGKSPLRKTGSPEGGRRATAGLTEIVETWTEGEAGDRKASFLGGDSCVFRAKVRFLVDVDCPHFSVAWISENDLIVFVASTVNRERHTGNYRAGDLADVRFEFNTLLAPGRYRMNMTVTRGAGQEVIERWDELSAILVTDPSATGGLLNLPFTTEVRSEHSASASSSR